MQKFLIISFLFLNSLYFVKAQQPSSSPSANQQQNNQQQNNQQQNRSNRSDTVREPTQQEIQTLQMRKITDAQNAELDNSLRNIKLIPQEVHNLYRKSKKEEKEILQPDQENLVKYSNFLRQRKTGITKLIASSECAENSNVVIASEKCLKYSMPGAGASYSFRINDYRIKRLADLTFVDGKFSAFGLLTQAIFVEIGDISLDAVDPNTDPIKFLTDFQPLSDFSHFKETHQQLVTTGIKHNNFVFKREITPQINKTYAFRSIAYNGESLRSFEGESYNEFSFDQRKDVIIIFQVIEIEPNQSITFIWKELSRKNSPKLKNLPERLD